MSLPLHIQYCCCSSSDILYANVSSLIKVITNVNINKEYLNSKITAGYYEKEEKCGECEAEYEKILQFKTKIKYSVFANTYPINFSKIQTLTSLSKSKITLLKFFTVHIKNLFKTEVNIFNKEIVETKINIPIKIYSIIADDNVVFVNLKQDLKYSYKKTVNIDLKGKSQITLDFSKSINSDITKIDTLIGFSFSGKRLTIIAKDGNHSIAISTATKEYILNLRTTNGKL